MAQSVKVALKDGTVSIYAHGEGYEDGHHQVLRVRDPSAHHLHPHAVDDLDDIDTWEYIED